MDNDLDDDENDDNWYISKSGKNSDLKYFLPSYTANIFFYASISLAGIPSMTYLIHKVLHELPDLQESVFPLLLLSQQIYAHQCNNLNIKTSQFIIYCDAKGTCLHSLKDKRQS